AFERDGAAVLDDDVARLYPVLDSHALRLRQILLVFTCLHLFRPAAIEDRHVLSAKQAGLDGDVDRRHAAADHHDAASDRKRAQVLGLAKARNIVDGVADALRLFPFGVERIHTLKSQGKEHRIMALPQTVERHLPAKLALVLDGDAADAEDEA